MVNGDPYRNAPQPPERRVINRSGAAYRPSDEPQPIREEPKAPSPRPVSAPRTERYESERKSSKWPLWISLIVLAIILVGAAFWFLSANNKSADTGIDNNKYQAVFLVNGQVYFGKLTHHNDEYLKLTTGYSAQAKNNTAAATEAAETATTDDGVQLIRLGDEVYGPENEIYISKAQILHYENLKSDSKVTQLIDQNEKAR